MCSAKCRPAAHNVLDNKLVEEGTRRAHTAQLEQKVAALQQELAAQAAGRAEEDGRRAVERGRRSSADRAARTRKQGGAHPHRHGRRQKCLLIPLDEGESARINGKETPL